MSASSWSPRSPWPSPVPPLLLLVDDDALLLEALGRRLRRLGYGVAATSSAAEALRWCIETPHRFAALFTDMDMPMSGPTLIRELAAAGCHIPAMTMSGRFPETVIAQRQIAKPFSTPELLAALAELGLAS